MKFDQNLKIDKLYGETEMIMTPVRILSFMVFITFLIILVLFFFKQYIFFTISLFIFIVVGYFWKRLLEEELIIHFVYIHNLETDYETVIEEFGEKKAQAVLKRLAQKNILEISNNRIRLTKTDYRFTIK